MKPKTAAPPKPARVSISQELLQTVVNYLQERPHKEVNGLISQMLADAAPLEAPKLPVTDVPAEGNGRGKNRLRPTKK